jgi:GNAT superfamily N-acetyltransferase
MLCRRLIVDDFENAVALYQNLATGTSVPEADRGRQMFINILAHPGTQIVGADVAGIIVSMATLHILPNMTYDARPYAVIENVATLPDHARKGFGRAVMEHAAEAAWQANAYKIMLHSGRSKNAAGFYEKLGYDSDEKHGFILRRPPR